MTIPESVLAIVREANDKYPADIEKAKAWAQRKVKAAADYEEFVSPLVDHCVTECLYDDRHKRNVKMRNEAGQVGGPAKTVVGASSAVQRASESLFRYRIAGTILSCVMGEDLAGIAESEAAKASGHSFNSRLAAHLDSLVPEGKTVGDVIVTERRLLNIFKKVDAQHDAAEATPRSKPKDLMPKPRRVAGNRKGPAKTRAAAAVSS